MKDRAWIVNEYCHLVNENICFIQKYFEGIVPAGRPNEELYWKTKSVGEQLRALLEEENRLEAKVKERRVNITVAGNCNTMEYEINRILEAYVKDATEYYEQSEPWRMIEQDRKACRNTILNSLQMLANLTVWLEILGEHPAHVVLNWLELDTSWDVHSVHSGLELSKAEELVLPAISCGA